MSAIGDKMAALLADSYALYLKSQNFHWHVKGLHFKALHELFEEHYTELATAIDEIAERIRTLGFEAPASFKAFDELKTLEDGEPNTSAEDMVAQLHQDHLTLVQHLNDAIQLASEAADEGTVALLSERIASHEKMAWMLSASMP